MLFPPLSCPQTSLAAAELGASSLAWLGGLARLDPTARHQTQYTVHSTTVQLQLLRKAFTQHTNSSSSSTTHHTIYNNTYIMTPFLQ